MAEELPLFTHSSSCASPIPWGGLLETLENCEEKDNIPDNLKILKGKLTRLENSKTLKDIQYSIHFTMEEQNYLNSPLLDEIYSTIFSDNPLNAALIRGKIHAMHFYEKRMHFCRTTTICRIVLDNWKKYKSEKVKLEILQFLLRHKIRIDSQLLYNSSNDENEITKFFVENVPFDKDDWINAVIHGKVEIAEIILKKIPETEIKNYIFNCTSSDLSISSRRFLIIAVGAFRLWGGPIQLS